MGSLYITGIVGISHSGKQLVLKCHDGDEMGISLQAGRDILYFLKRSKGDLTSPNPGLGYSEMIFPKSLQSRLEEYVT
jgi:hypothetical protein